MATSRVYEALTYVLTRGAVRRAAAEAVFTLLIVAMRQLTDRDDELP